jgi:hypothetical protein
MLVISHYLMCISWKMVGQVHSAMLQQVFLFTFSAN